MGRRLIAEFLGTFWLVFCGCGTAVFGASIAAGGIGALAVAVAFGLAFLTGAYAFGYISGAHFNPAVTAGLAAAGQFPRSDIIPYIVSQTIGGIAAAIGLYLMAIGSPSYTPGASLAANGYGMHSPGGYSWGAGLGGELLLTAGFVLVITFVTARRSLRAFAPLIIGFTLTLANLVCIPLTNASINPARSSGPALVTGDWALAQLWLFWLAPILGGIAGGSIARILIAEETAWGTSTSSNRESQLRREAEEEQRQKAANL